MKNDLLQFIDPNYTYYGKAKLPILYDYKELFNELKDSKYSNFKYSLKVIKDIKAKLEKDQSLLRGFKRFLSCYMLDNKLYSDLLDYYHLNVDAFIKQFVEDKTKLGYEYHTLKTNEIETNIETDSYGHDFSWWTTYSEVSYTVLIKNKSVDPSRIYTKKELKELAENKDIIVLSRNVSKEKATSVTMGEKRQIRIDEGIYIPRLSSESDHKYYSSEIEDTLKEIVSSNLEKIKEDFEKYRTRFNNTEEVFEKLVNVLLANKKANLNRETSLLSKFENENQQ